MEHKSISLPKQARSRDSYLRLRTAAVDLLREEGPSALTVARVSARAGIAVGTLYGRVGSRSQLVRIVHQEELTRIVDDLHHRLAPLTRAPEDIDAVRSTIERLAQSLQEEAPVLTSLIAMGQEDEMLRAHGREAWNKTRGVTIDALRRSMPSGRDRSSDTMEWVFEVAYALIARRLDIGGAHPRSPEPSSSFTQFVEHVTRTAMALFAYSAPGGADTPTTRSHDGASPPGAVH